MNFFVAFFVKSLIFDEQEEQIGWLMNYSSKNTPIDDYMTQRKAPM